MKDYTLGLYEKSMPDSLAIGEKLDTAARNGFDFMELSVDETDGRLARLSMPRGERAALAAAMCDTGTGIRTMCLSGHRRYPIGSADPAVRRRGMEIMEGAIALAEDLGIRIIQLAGYDVYYEESTETTRAHFRDNLGKCAAMAARAGVTLAFETMETEFMNTVAKAMRYVREIDSPWLQVYPDLGNITNAAKAAGADVLSDLESGRGRIAAVHLKESVPGKYREIPYGTGHVDFESCIGKVRAMGVGLFVAEFWHAGDERWAENIAHAAKFFGGLFDRTKQAG